MIRSLALAAFALFSTLSGEVDARVFTDHQGRTIEAEIVGVRGDDVILSRGRMVARWPREKLSEEDQAYVTEWSKDPPVVSRVTARIFDRQGFSSAGVLEAGGGTPELLKNIPLLRQTEERDKFKYYDVDLFNESPQDATNLTMAYVLYVISPSGGVVPLTGTEAVETIATGTRVTAPTKSATYTSTTTTETTFNINRLGGLSTGSNSARETERFGGVWVRVYESDGSIVGESQDLHPSIARARPAWVGAPGSDTRPAPEQPTAIANLPPLPDLPLPESFEQLEKILSGLMEKVEEVIDGEFPPAAHLPVPLLLRNAPVPSRPEGGPGPF